MMQPPTTASRPISMAIIQGFLSRTYKSKFVRNVAVVASGTMGAQAITMVFAPAITRLYGPEAFGLLGTFMTIAAVVTPIASLSYPIAIVLSPEDVYARGIARLSAYIALGMAALVALVLFMAGNWVVELLQIQEISSFILLLPLVIVFSAWLQINQQWLIRKKQFKITARVAVLQSFLINSATAGIGLLKPIAAVLIVIYTLGSALYAFILSLGAKKADDCQDKEETLPKKQLWELAKRYYDFPLYRAPNEFINAISQGLPILMLAAYSGPISAGFYTLCRKLLNKPTLLISSSVGEVFYPKIVEVARSGRNVTEKIIKATLCLAGIGFLPFTLVVAFGPWLFGFIFGQEWVFAGEYARWLAVMGFFQFINTPTVKAVPVLGLQPFLLFYGVSVSILRIIGLSVGFLVFHNDLYAIALFSLVGTMMYILLISYVVVKSNHY